MEDVLRGLGIMVAIAGSFFGLIFAAIISHFVIKKLWPTALGVGVGYYLWTNIDTDLAVIFGVLCVAVQILWWKRVNRENNTLMQHEFKKPEEKQNVTIPGYFDYY